MRTARRLRPVVCVLLAVATAVGPAPLARACDCPLPTARPATPTAAPAAVESCCGAGGCCAAAKGRKSCCSPADTPTPARSSDPGCGCVACECGGPDAPAPAVPNRPAGGDEVAPVQPAVAAAVLFLLPPVTADPANRAALVDDRTPPDLVITLSRLTC